MSTLSKRAQTLLIEKGVQLSPDAVRRAIEGEVIKPNRNRGYGPVLTQEIYEFAGLPQPAKIDLDRRSQNRLYWMNIPVTPEAVRAAILDGTISKETRECGPVTLRNLRAFAGLPPEEPYRAPWWKYDPRTGRKL